MANHLNNNRGVLALDVGDKRIGIAYAGWVARLAKPLTTLVNNEVLADELAKLIKQHDIDTLVVGLPRGMQGQTTEQTTKTNHLLQSLDEKLSVDIEWQDETLSSVQAKEELRQRGIRYNKEAVDELAACIILEDFLRSHSHS